MPIEVDTPPEENTFKSFLRNTVSGLSVFRNFWGRRFAGGLIGIVSDMLAEGAIQTFYARLPGHPDQSDDSLAQVGFDRDLVRFRGEDKPTLAARVLAAWDDYAQGGTKQQMIRVVNQWGRAGWPLSWVDIGDSQWSESAHTAFTFTIIIPFGSINPPWVPWRVGDPVHVGDSDLYVGIGPSADIPMVIYLIKKWKPARSKGTVRIYYTITDSVSFTIGQGGY